MLTTGVDLVKVSRIEEVISNNRDSFYKKVFTNKEIKYIDKVNGAETTAGLFAAKEAISKALGTGIGKIRWHDIEITHSTKGKPLVTISPRLRVELAKQNLNSIEISISHEKEYAVAFAVCFNDLSFK